jgi:hypothetical protein
VSTPPPPAGLPGFGSAPCLGCDELVVESEPLCKISGRPDGRHLLFLGVLSDDHGLEWGDESAGGPEYLLGVTHRGQCIEDARDRIASGVVVFDLDRLPLSFTGPDSASE